MKVGFILYSYGCAVESGSLDTVCMMVRDIDAVWIGCCCVCWEEKTDPSFHLEVEFEHHQERFGLTKEISAPALSTSSGYLNIEGGKYRAM